MKNRWKLALCVLGLACLLTACVDNKEESKDEIQTDDVSTEEIEKDAKQLAIEAKLEMIEPSAYGNAKGLELEKGAYISVLGKGAKGEYWEEVKKGVEQAGKDINKELGYEGNDKVKVTYSGPEVKDDIDEQVNILDEEIARYPVAIAMSIADVQACEVQFDLATQNGIPLVAFDSGSGYQGLQATATTDNKKAARVTADKLGEIMDGEGKVIMFVHDSKSKAAADRENAFKNRIKKEYPDMEVVKVFHIDETKEIKKLLADEKNKEAGTAGTENEILTEDITTEEVVDYILDEYSDVTGCFATNGDAMELAVEGFERQNRSDVCIVGFDANEYEIEALEAGKIKGLLIQNPYGMGYAAVIAAARAYLELGNEAFINTGYTWVTQESLATQEVQNILYFK